MSKVSRSPSFVPTSNVSKLYAMELYNANILGDDLFSSSFISAIRKLFNDPGNALISVRVYPMYFAPNLLDDTTFVKVGNYTTTAHGRPLKNNANLSITVGTFEITQADGHVLNNFLDYRSSFRVFCPFYGYIDLNPADVIGQTITVKYVIDVFSGSANIYIDTAEKTIASATCQIAVDLPIGNSNARDKALAVLNGALSTSVAAVSGNFAGAAAGALSLAAATTENISTASRVGGGYGCFYSANECFMVRRYPQSVAPSGYNSHYGRPLMSQRTLANVNGFTVVDSVHMEGFDRATAEERAEVERLLKAGVIL